MTQVSLEQLTKHYGAMVAVDALDLRIEAGTLAALLGPSGCGKSTTLRMIAGLLAPTSGDIHFDDRSVVNVAAERRGAVMVFQKHLLFPHMSVGENVAFGLRMRGEPRDLMRRKVADMLEMVQLGGFEGRRSHELSGGQQQRVALARALVVEPAVLLLDEPLANLDANLRVEMRRLIRTLQQQLKMTTIFVTHDQEEAIMLADQVALMGQGRLLQAGSPRTLYERPASPAVARFFRNENLMMAIKQGATVELLQEDGQRPAHRLTLGASEAVACADGPVWLTVRPEHVQAGRAGDMNTLPAQQVGDAIYMGSYTQMQVDVMGSRWSIHLAGDGPVVGQLAIHLPPARIWLMPRA